MEEFEKWTEEETRSYTKEYKKQLLEHYEFREILKKEKGRINFLKSFISKTKKVWIFSKTNTLAELYLICRAENTIAKYSEKQLSTDIVANEERIKDLEDIIHALNLGLKKRLQKLINKVTNNPVKFHFLNLVAKIQSFLEFATKGTNTKPRGTPQEIKENMVLII